MSDPKPNEDGLKEDELNELEALRASYHEAVGDAEPSELLDARIRKLSRDDVRGAHGQTDDKTHGRRNLAAWSGVIGLAATVGFAVVLVPAVLIREPAPSAQDTAQFEVRLQERSAVDQSIDELEEERAATAKMEADAESAQRERRIADDARQQRSLVAAAPAPTVLAEAALAPAPSAIKEDVLKTLNAASANGELDIDALRAELAQAPEPEWRATLVALRDSQQRSRAEELLPEYREKFDLPETLTLDQLVVDAGGSQ